MTRQSTRWALGIALCAAWAGCDAPVVRPIEQPAGYTIDPPPLSDRPIDALLTGEIDGLGDYVGLSGRAQLVRLGDGTTRAEIYVDGLAPMVSFGAHVHVWPCGIAQGGGHYKIDPTVEEIIAENEIWPIFTTDAYGVGTSSVTVPHAARGDAQSIVIHDPMADNTQMACADLRPPDAQTWRAEGRLAPFASATEADGTIAGSATLDVSPEGTRIELAVTGLRPDAAYAAHVHALPCHVDDGGGHYKITPTIDDTRADNELWPMIEPDAAGAASATLSHDHPVRPSAQSIVIHREAGDARPKVACATLVRQDYGDAESTGFAVPLDAAGDRGYLDLAGEGTLTRRLDGTTTALIAMQGLTPDALYPVHLHASSCTVNAGSGHYKIDPTVEETVAENELWLSFETDGSGVGVQSAAMPALARPEGIALVVHDHAEDGARVACIELR